MSTLNHDTELEELVRDIMKVPYSKHNAKIAIDTYLYKQTLELIGYVPAETELWRYNNELRGKYEERHKLRKAAAERWGQE